MRHHVSHVPLTHWPEYLPPVGAHCVPSAPVHVPPIAVDSPAASQTIQYASQYSPLAQVGVPQKSQSLRQTLFVPPSVAASGMQL
jgi:hypothetical protein